MSELVSKPLPLVVSRTSSQLVPPALIIVEGGGSVNSASNRDAREPPTFREHGERHRNQNTERIERSRRTAFSASATTGTECAVVYGSQGPRIYCDTVSEVVSKPLPLAVSRTSQLVPPALISVERGGSVNSASNRDARGPPTSREHGESHRKQNTQRIERSRRLSSPLVLPPGPSAP